MRTARNSDEVRIMLRAAAADARRTLTQQVRDRAPRPLDPDSMEADDEQG
jgi:hypothetical protein